MLDHISSILASHSLKFMIVSMFMKPNLLNVAVALIAPVLFVLLIGILRQEASGSASGQFGSGAAFLQAYEEAKDGKPVKPLRWMLERQYRLGRLAGGR